jgi:hypothetical protein
MRRLVEHLHDIVDGVNHDMAIKGNRSLDEMTVPKEVWAPLIAMAKAVKTYAGDAEDAFGRKDLIMGLANVQRAMEQISHGIMKATKKADVVKMIDKAGSAVLHSAEVFFDKGDY